MEQTVEVIACGPENVAEFNARLRSDLPGLHSLAKALHDRGMIDGLRGACIGPARGVSAGGVVPVLSMEAEARSADRAWEAGQWKEHPGEAEIREANLRWLSEGRRSMGAKA